MSTFAFIRCGSGQRWRRAKGKPHCDFISCSSDINGIRIQTNKGLASDPESLTSVRLTKSRTAFQGFANDQLARLVGSKGGGQHGQRPEYIGKFGYDTKAAMHVIRLLNEGIEFIARGTITLPRAGERFVDQIGPESSAPRESNRSGRTACLPSWTRPGRPPLFRMNVDRGENQQFDRRHISQNFYVGSSDLLSRLSSGVRASVVKRFSPVTIEAGHIARSLFHEVPVLRL